MNRRKTTAFYLETLLQTFFLLCVIVVLVQLLALAHGMGRQADHTTHAVLIAQNAAAQYAACPDEESFVAAVEGTAAPEGCQAAYGADGRPAPEGEYRMMLTQATPADAPAGYAQGEIAVYWGEPAGEPLAQLPVARYTPG